MMGAKSAMNLKSSVWVLTLAGACVLATITVEAAPADRSATIRPDGSSIFADVAEKVRPAVVFIRTERAMAANDREPSDTPFDFFREFFPDGERSPHGRRVPGGGSGFVFDDEGRILTNYHVIRDADKITVILDHSGDESDSDGTEFDAHVVGFDRHTDIAIIQVDDAKGLPKVTLGDSDAMRVGDWVMAIGTPFGQLQGTVTVGIVSAKERSDLNIVGGEATYQNYIQTDASINFGNSGGPLVNLNGEAIGINTAINPSGQGIGFAIPINMAKGIMAELIASGRVKYGYLGIVLQELDADLAEGMGIALKHGIVVREVQPGTSAARAGLHTGDVIVRYDGEDVRDDGKFRLKVASTPVGKTVPVVVYRDGKEQAIDVTLGERPEDEAVASAPEPRSEAWLGLHVDAASKGEVRRIYRLDRGQEGVVVIEVEEGSPAEDAGLREGDIITEVYSHEVKSIDDYAAVSKKLQERKDPIAFLVKRGRSTTFVTVFPERR
ncbi:MAG TPA: Do family serine endopeptidase [Candidatus Krumholzibacteria bacterium]|nr:Do family serine endopeptidase [Candidatus Krumholzibacteria bacterium]